MNEIPNINYYGKSISYIIIYIILIISIIIILDEIINITKFCYKYTYLYNYGRINEKICKNDKETSVLEYEKSRFRVLNILNDYKLTKDLFNKNWINYITYVIIIILILIFFLSFGTFFYYLFIKDEKICNIDDNDTDNMNFIKRIIKCFLGDFHKLLPNCTFNYIILFILIVVYPIIFILKSFFKTDYTFENNSYWVKNFHIIFILILFYYIIVLMKDKKYNTIDKYSNVVIYISYIIIFYISQNHIYKNNFDDYNNKFKLSNIYNKEKDKNDTIFFDIYKQEEPIKPIEPQILKEPLIDNNGSNLLMTFKYCSDKELELKQDYYCSNIDVYKNNLNKITNYYNSKKTYDEIMKIYNYKFNIYKNNIIEFPQIIYIYTTMLPKLLGIDKSLIIILIICIIIFIIIYILLNYYNKNNNFNDYFYNTIFIYLIGILSISILSNSILTYNTYFNKYHIYEPIAQYKFDLNKLNTLFNLSINNINQDTNNKLDLYKIITNNQINLTNNLNNSNLFDDDFYINKIKNNTINIDTELNTFIRIDNSNNVINMKNAINIGILSSFIYRKDIKRENNNLIDINNNFYRNNNFDFFYQNTFNLLDYNLERSETNIISNNINTYFQIIKGTFLNDPNLLEEKISKIKNNIKYLIYNDYNKLNINKNIDNNNFYFNLLYIDNISNEIIEKIDNSKDTELIKLYKKNILNINKILYYYGEFLIEIRNSIIKLLNSSSIYCDKSNIINLNIKLNNYIKQIFNFRNNQYIFKSTSEEPKINIYKSILSNSMNEFNNIYRKYFNIIKFLIIKNIKENNDYDYYTLKIIQEIINNYNIYNKNNNKYINKNLLNNAFILECKEYINKFNKFTNKEKKELNINTNNISWSFIILVIIFAIILIEPTII
jgi:hypothetical protein